MCTWVGRYSGVADEFLTVWWWKGWHTVILILRRKAWLTSTILPSHLDDVDWWHRLVELQQTGGQKKQKSDSPPRGPFHQRLQSFVWRSGTRWLAGWIERRWMYLQLWDYCIYGCEHWDVMHMETNAHNFFALQQCSMSKLRPLGSWCKTLHHQRVWYWFYHASKRPGFWCVIRTNGGT